MKTIFNSIIKFRKSILIVFGILMLISILLIPGTKVNYKLIDYLPKDANSTQAIQILDSSFESRLPNLSVMIQNVSLQEGIAYKKQLEAIEGVHSVMWLDDVLGAETLKTTPLSFLDQKTVEGYYRNQAALYSLVISNGLETQALESIYQLVGEENAVIGQALENASAQSSSIDEVIKAMIILIPIIIIILIIATISWLEPILFMLTIGVAIAINMGTNIIFGEVSFITQTVSPILQLAVSMDYAIFLLHSFTEKRKLYNPDEAMFHAMKESLPTVTASAMTTAIGFSALIFMRFGIGADLGINLFKGIMLSFASVMVFLPVITLICYKWIEKTMHKDYLPHPGGLSRVLVKIRTPILLIALIIAIPAFLGQSKVEFIYGMEVDFEGSRPMRDQSLIDDVFGTEKPMVLIIPKEELSTEKALSGALENIPNITQVIAYTEVVGTKIPKAYAPDEVTGQFYSEKYTRMIIYADIPSEGQVAFSTVDQILETASQYYDDYYLSGQAPTLNDMKKVVAVDMGRINLIAIAGIFIVLLLTFKSITLPILLIFTIESAIWINLSIPYFMGTTISFIGYLIISTVQLGATVDYAILMTNRYLNARQDESKKEAMWHALQNNVAAILVSATILSIAGFILASTTNNPMIKELGILLGRGTILSFIMVVGVLPALLLLFDKVIQKTTLAHKFYQEKEGQ